MNNSLIIRKALPSDAEWIIRFNAAIGLETENLELNFEVLRQGVQALLADINKGFYIVAEIDGKVVGQLMVTYEWSDWRNGQFWWIQSVYVLPEFRQKGVFKKLYNYIYNIALNEKNVCGLRLYVDKNNERAKRTYENIGLVQSHYNMYEMEIKKSK